MAHQKANQAVRILAAFWLLGACCASKLLEAKMQPNRNAPLIEGRVPTTEVPTVEINTDTDVYHQHWLAWPRRLAAQAGTAASTTFAFVPQYLPGGDQRRVAAAPTRAPTKAPTKFPTKKPTAKPTPKPTAKATPKPTAKAATPAPQTGAARTSTQWSATDPQPVFASSAPSNTTSALLPWLHNQYRLRHQNTNPLKWNSTLAASAQSWANKCVVQHSGTPGVGENLYEGLYWANQPFSISDGWASAIYGFYKEISSYDHSKPGFTEAAGHFTALVWAATTTVGCGAQTCPPPPGYTGVNAVIYVCQYYSAGNVATTDYFKANVFPLV